MRPPFFLLFSSLVCVIPVSNRQVFHQMSDDYLICEWLPVLDCNENRSPATYCIFQDK